MDILDDVHAETFELIDGVQKRLYLNCRFINPEKIEDGAGIRGYKFTVECDSLMAWQDTITSTYPLSHDSESSNSVITVKTDSDLNDYIYPKVTITIGSSGGDITISNNTDNESRLTSFEGLTSNIELIMDGEFNYVSGQNFEKFSDRNFIRLLDGENKINVVGDITSITFEWNNRRYL